jgi:hypothetical protein
MSNKRRVAERNLGVFLSPGGSAGEGGYVVPMNNLNVGPGEPGPADEWHMPTAPDEVEDEAKAVPVATAGTVVLSRPGGKG